MILVELNHVITCYYLPSASKAAKVHRTDLFELQAAELANLPEPSSSECLSKHVFELKTLHPFRTSTDTKSTLSKSAVRHLCDCSLPKFLPSLTKLRDCFMLAIALEEFAHHFNSAHDCLSQFMVLQVEVDYVDWECA